MGPQAAWDAAYPTTDRLIRRVYASENGGFPKKEPAKKKKRS
jgi:hypothetical protein